MKILDVFPFIDYNALQVFSLLIIICRSFHVRIFKRGWNLFLIEGYNGKKLHCFHNVTNKKIRD